MKLTEFQEQATTVDENVQNSEEKAQSYEQKNKVKIWKILSTPNIIYGKSPRRASRIRALNF